MTGGLRVVLALALLLTTVLGVWAAAPALDTRVSVLDRADIDRGESALFPIRIENVGSRAATYDISVSGTDGWGTWRVDPDTTVTVAAGKETTLYLHLDTDKDAQAGTRHVGVTVKSGAQSTSTEIALYIRAPVRHAGAPGWITALQGGLTLLLLALLIVAIMVAASRMRRRGRKHKGGRIEVVDIDDDGEAPTVNVTRVPAKKQARRTIAVEPATERKRIKTNY